MDMSLCYNTTSNTNRLSSLFALPAGVVIPTEQVLSSIEVCAHRCLFDFFKQVRSDDNNLYSVQFDVLLGTYCNTLNLLRFLELGLSVACVCTKFPELGYVRDGVIQFEVQQPMIARDGPHPLDQPVHNYMVKRIHKRSLSAAFSIASEALCLINKTHTDGTLIESSLRLRAIQQLARNLRAVLDSFERGAADQLLGVLLDKAPPLSLLVPLSRFQAECHLVNRVTHAALISELKQRIRKDIFFMTKYERNPNRILGYLSEMVSCTQPSVTASQITHSNTRGREVDGVIVTTSSLRRKLLQGILHVDDTSADVPVTYGEMVIQGTNLVTALVMGKAVRGMDDVAKYLLDIGDSSVPSLNINKHDSSTLKPVTARVSADLVTIGDKLVFLESLERRVYQSTRVSYPLIGNLDITFVMPLGVFQTNIIDRYSRHAGDFVTPPDKPDPRQFPPQTLFFYNKDGLVTKLTMQDAMGTICHSSLLDIEDTLTALRRGSINRETYFGAYVSNGTEDSLDIQMERFMELWPDMTPTTPAWTLESHLTTQQFMAPGNERLIYELNPAFDFFVAPGDLDLPGPERPPETMPTINASLRIINGNIPIPLCPIQFRDARGFQLSTGKHSLHPLTIRAVTETFQDRAYPTILYILEAIIHGNERNFCSILRLLSQCIRGYWEQSHKVAFINNFHMLVYITTYLGNGELPEPCIAIYRDLLQHTRALKQTITEYTVIGDTQDGESPEALNNILCDDTFLPPVLWDCDPLMYRDEAARDRLPTIRTGGLFGYQAIHHVDLQRHNFQRRDNVLIHGRPVRGDVAQGAPIATHHDREWNTLAKIYYYVIVPTFSKGTCCTMGIRYDRIYPTIQTIVIPDIPGDEQTPTNIEDPRHPLHPHQLVPNSLNVYFHNAKLIVDGDALLTLQELMTDMAERTTPILTSIAPDAGATTVITRNMRTYDGALYHGLIMMSFPSYDETIMTGTFFYPVPVNPLFSCAEHLTSLRGMNNIRRSLTKKMSAIPPFLGSNYYATIRQPIAHHAQHSTSDSNILSYALLGDYFKFTPLSLTHQLRTAFHPGIAFTVVRQDKFSTEQILYAERASESYFVGQIQVNQNDSPGGVNFTLTQPRAHVDLGIGYTAVCATAALRCPLTDMGNTAQNLFFTRGALPMLHADVNETLRRIVAASTKITPTEPLPIFGGMRPYTPAGIARGQSSICEFIAMPVSVDIQYFRTACNPRGRSSGYIYCGDNESDFETVMFDHSQADVSYTDRATINPWASQRYSYGDKLYNGSYNLSGASPLYSPCFKFFTPMEIKNQCNILDRLILESRAVCSQSPADTEYQFKRPPGSNELTQDPCTLFQEGYPPLCASDLALLTAARNINPTTSETHLAQYLIYDASPIRGCLSVSQ
ncbi:major capsid protein [Cercopithecine alphaherpesvirus 9]|uniref:Major capsid protein n=1 Tax=Cercopithecine herpesvirus 9 (strain DHV) TaxID=36348 RepID=Q9E1X9_CHV9D|nr:major capsid protein [Cercopithecine alphaherpesvirus 9]AAG27215.1 major capsid protein [Cercopithecine alphaherpesvirus 9]